MTNLGKKKVTEEKKTFISYTLSLLTINLALLIQYETLWNSAFDYFDLLSK